MLPSYAVGIVNYRSYQELGSCLDALACQTQRPNAIVVVDVEPDPARRSGLRERCDIRWEDSENRGFAGGANLALGALRERTPSDFFLLLTPDVRLEPSFVEHLLREMADRPRVALGTGKLLRPDGSIDSAGVR